MSSVEIAQNADERAKAIIDFLKQNDKIKVENKAKICKKQGGMRNEKERDPALDHCNDTGTVQCGSIADATGHG